MTSRLIRRARANDLDTGLLQRQSPTSPRVLVSRWRRLRGLGRSEAAWISETPCTIKSMKSG